MNAGLGASEQRTKPYMQYGEGAVAASNNTQRHKQ